MRWIVNKDWHVQKHISAISVTVRISFNDFKSPPKSSNSTKLERVILKFNVEFTEGTYSVKTP